MCFLASPLSWVVTMDHIWLQVHFPFPKDVVVSIKAGSALTPKLLTVSLLCWTKLTSIEEGTVVPPKKHHFSFGFIKFQSVKCHPDLYVFKSQRNWIDKICI